MECHRAGGVCHRQVEVVHAGCCKAERVRIPLVVIGVGLERDDASAGMVMLDSEAGFAPVRTCLNEQGRLRQGDELVEVVGHVAG